MEQSCIVIQGGKRLEGELTVQGSKNTVLPVMAASLLAEGVTVLHRVPLIADVLSMIEVMEQIGCKIEWEKDTLFIDTGDSLDSDIPAGKVGDFRGSALLMGALLAKNGKVSMEKPGGCKIGERPLNFHLDGFRRLGAKATEAAGRYECSGDRLFGNHIYLPFPSVGATENLMIAAAKGYGITWIHGCAKEPEICDLARFLKRMGGWIEGEGTSHIKIFGRRKLFPVEYTIPYDRIAAATYLFGAVITEGNVTLRLNTDTYRMENILCLLEKMGARIARGKASISLCMKGMPQALQVETGPYPGIPTDVQSMVMAVMLYGDGPSVIKENIFESRFAIGKELEKMGGKVMIDKDQAFVFPVGRLQGAMVTATDLRGGAALCLAALMAEGETKIQGSSNVKRGYVDIAKDFSQLGAQIQEVMEREGRPMERKSR